MSERLKGIKLDKEFHLAKEHALWHANELQASVYLYQYRGAWWLGFNPSLESIQIDPEKLSFPKRWMKLVEWHGVVEEIECMDHCYSHPGPTLCAGPKTCLYCGKLEEE